jgi:hypothetical protein
MRSFRLAIAATALTIALGGCGSDELKDGTVPSKEIVPAPTAGMDVMKDQMSGKPSSVSAAPGPPTMDPMKKAR